MADIVILNSHVRRPIVSLLYVQIAHQTPLQQTNCSVVFADYPLRIWTLSSMRMNWPTSMLAEWSNSKQVLSSIETQVRWQVGTLSGHYWKQRKKRKVTCCSNCKEESWISKPKKRNKNRELVHRMKAMHLSWRHRINQQLWIQGS